MAVLRCWALHRPARAARLRDCIERLLRSDSYAVRQTSLTLYDAASGANRTADEPIRTSHRDASAAEQRARAGDRRRARRPSTGSSALSMRKLADELGVAAMSLYYYVPNKVDLTRRDDRHRLQRDRAAVDSTLDWKTAMRQRALSTREALNRHRWAVGLMEGRTDPRAGEPPPPRRGARVPARGRLLAGDDRPRLLGPGRLHLRLRAPGDRHVPRDLRRLRGGGRAADGRRTRTCWPTTPTSSRWSAATSRSRATTTPPSSSSASTSSSTGSTGSAGDDEGS